ncbi:MAG TPA: hypothetical protein VFK02_33595, partial [Kofleriaceae bacterium]|nr:hypothetical protein [Kofleriaceae bacterium]
ALPRRSSGGLWLAGAILAAAAAAGATIADRMTVGSSDRVSATALAGDAERISSVFDAAARSAHIRADGIATTPMLRAAIETDAATLSDLAHSEMVFIAGKGEALEVYQFIGDKPNSLLRIPKSARSLPALKGRDTRLQTDASGATLVASAPISGYRAGMGGVVVISMPVDLTSVRRALEDHAAQASLTGLGGELPLVAASEAAGGEAVKLAVPSSGEWTAGSATLVATPRKSAGLGWVGAARGTSGGLSVLLLVGFVVSLVRRPRS